MATVYKILGQAAPSATTNTTLYTAPAGYGVVTSTLSVCNRASTSASFRIAVVPSGGTLANEHYIAYDAVAAGNDFIGLTLGLTLAAGDSLVVYSSSANLSFSLFGTEITA